MEKSRFELMPRGVCFSAVARATAEDSSQMLNSKHIKQVWLRPWHQMQVTHNTPCKRIWAGNTNGPQCQGTPAIEKLFFLKLNIAGSQGIYDAASGRVGRQNGKSEQKWQLEFRYFD
jgi:hypothetical protein